MTGNTIKRRRTTTAGKGNDIKMKIAKEKKEMKVNSQGSGR